MNDSYSSVSEKGLAQWRLQQAAIILEDTAVKNKVVKPYLHVLTYTSNLYYSDDNDTFTVSKQDKTAEDLNNRFSKLQKNITSSMNKIMHHKNQPMIDNHKILSSRDLVNRKMNLKDEITTLRDEVNEVKNKINSIISKSINRKVVSRQES